MVKIKVDCLDLEETLDCGQCFRWQKEENAYIGVVQDRVVKLWMQGDILFAESNKEEDLEDFVVKYLDLQVDYAKIERELARKDKVLAKCIANTSGLHFVNQDKLEIVITFIISANNNIPRITKSVQKIAETYGKKVEFAGKEYFLFPDAKELSKASKEDLRLLGVGFRDKYIAKTVQMLVDREIDLEEIACLETDALKRQLMRLPGVGSKVADCVMLFAYGRKECFPVDVWIKRVMQNLYYNKEEIAVEKILEDAKKRFGNNAGIAQQHLYQNGRKGNI